MMSNEDISNDAFQHEMLHSKLKNNDITYDQLSPENLIGVEFETVETAETFYYAYAKEMGFGVRKDDMRKSTRTGIVTIRQWVCSAAGERREKHTKNTNRVRMQKKLTRCHCPCLFKIRYSKEKNLYVVADFRTDHSHDLVPPHESYLLRAHRSVSDSHIALATSMRNVSIKTTHTYQYMTDVSGGFGKVGFTLKDLYNKLDARQREAIIGGDTNATLAYLKGKAAEDKNSFYKYSTDKNNRLTNLFWRDSTSLADYCCFGDVLVFDSTYKTNHYGKPLVLFVGSNNHLLTTIFGFALLVDETEATYTWVLQSFLESMQDLKPRAILTDGDEAMRNAIEVVFPGCPHRLCSWHVSKNALRNLRNPKIVAEFRRCMFDEITPDGFEQRWRNMVDKYGLQNRRWVKMMYDKRHKWAQAFVSGYFFALMRSTQRCEGMNRYMKADLTFSGVRLNVLVPRLDKSTGRLRNKSLKEDFRSNNFSHVLTTQLQQLEKHASTLSTDNVFQLICVEIDRIGRLITSEVMHLSSCRVYITSSYNNDEEYEYTTTYYHKLSDPRLVCSCLFFEHEGIPCFHLFNVMKHELMREIPRTLVLKRWTKQAKSEVCSRVPKENMSSEALQLARHGDLTYLGSKISYLASQT